MLQVYFGLCGELLKLCTGKLCGTSGTDTSGETQVGGKAKDTGTSGEDTADDAGTQAGTDTGATTVNFNINTLDASGFDDLLIRNRGTITSIINSAVNERGSKNLI